MSKGKRYDEPKLNLKKVFAVIVAIIVFIMFIFIIKGLLTKDKEQGKIISKDYFASFKNNKWGIIDESGVTVIDPSYTEMLVVPNNKKDIFICTYDVNYETGTYKTKAINSKHQPIFTNYDQVEAISNKDENNNLWYESSVLKVTKNNKYGLINLEGNEITNIEYDEIVGLEGLENILKVKKDNLYGVLDNEGNILLKTEYKDIKKLGKDKKEGFIVQTEEGKYGIYDYLGNQILDSNYEEILNVYSNEFFVVKKQGKEILIKKDGTEVLTGEIATYDEIKQILKNTENGVIFTKENKYGVMKTTGEVIIEPSFEELKEAKSGVLIAKQSGKYAIIDMEKNNKTEYKYTSIEYDAKSDIYIAEDESFNNDIIDNTFSIKQTGIMLEKDNQKGCIKLKQGEDVKYYNFKFEEKLEKDIYPSRTLFISKKDGKYGFLDKDGNLIVDYIYDDAVEQNLYGFSAIKKDGKWGSIDSKGNIVQAPIYNLDEYLKIDFIGKWHLGKDINMNYYNCQ